MRKPPSWLDSLVRNSLSIGADADASGTVAVTPSVEAEGTGAVSISSAIAQGAARRDMARRMCFIRNQAPHPPKGEFLYVFED